MLSDIATWDEEENTLPHYSDHVRDSKLVEICPGNPSTPAGPGSNEKPPDYSVSHDVSDIPSYWDTIWASTFWGKEDLISNIQSERESTQARSNFWDGYSRSSSDWHGDVPKEYGQVLHFNNGSITLKTIVYLVGSSRDLVVIIYRLEPSLSSRASECCHFAQLKETKSINLSELPFSKH